MNHDKRIEMLSAYLDGESTNPGAVERLLRESPEAQRLLAALKAQSESLRGLPQPEVGPEFACRVLARVHEERTGRRRPWAPLALPFAAAAALALVLGAVYLAHQFPSRAPGWPLEHRVTLWRDADPESLDAALFEQLAAYPDAMGMLDEFYGGIGEEAPLEPDEVVALGLMADVIDNETELDSLLDVLSPGEQAVLRDLLLEYAMEG